jgi:hypothetical protein
LATSNSTPIYTSLTDVTQKLKLRDKPAGRFLRRYGMNGDPSSGQRERTKHDAGDSDFCQSMGNEGDAGAGLHQHQCGLMPDLDDDRHVQVQRVEQIENMPAAMQMAFGMPDDDMLAVEIGRVDVGLADNRMGSGSAVYQLPLLNRSNAAFLVER